MRLVARAYIQKKGVDDIELMKILVIPEKIQAHLIFSLIPWASVWIVEKL